ncbi:2'-5' RNA ligase family protein [Streptomyces shenzhenensis]
MTPQLLADPQAFPPAPPADLDNSRTITEHDWKAFTSIDWLDDHWSRPGWPSGRRAYYWMLTFPDAPALLNQTRHCQKELAHLGMDPVPGDGLHVTMPRIGDTANVTKDQVQHLAELSERLPLEQFRLLAHPLAGSRGAVRFSLSPWTPLVRLHAALHALGRRAGVPGGAATTAFRPHLGIQYNNCRRPAGPVIDSVACLRALPPVHLEITSVDLVELRQTTGTPRAYCWTVVRTVPLRPSSRREQRTR